jgi:hypothetical protein
MKNFLRVKCCICFWLFPLFIMGGLTKPLECYGQDEPFPWDLYEKHSNSPNLIGTVTAVRSFFEALRQGRGDLIFNMMDRNLQDEYRSSLNDPSYPDLLRKIYGGSQIQIKRFHEREDGFFEIDVQLISQRSGVTEFRFELGSNGNRQSYSLKSFTIKD